MASNEFYDQLNAAIGAHGGWKFRLRQEVARGTAGNIAREAGDYNNCAFGTWLRSLDGVERTKPEAVEVIKLHQAFHNCARKVATECGCGRSDAAKTMLDGELTNLSKQLTSAMTRWKLKKLAEAA
jgi:hypothetical protein